MTHMQFIGAALVCLLVANGYGMLRVLRHTGFVAGVVSDSMAEAGSGMADLSERDEEDDEVPAAMGFHRPQGD